MKRKGQFFIISVVVVVILLMSITRILSKEELQDTSEHLQDLNDAFMLLKTVNYELEEIISIASNEDIYYILDSYLASKKKSIGIRGYLMDYKLNKSADFIKISYDIESIHMEQKIPMILYNRIAAWDFDDGAGVVAKDKTGSNDGELINFSWTKNSGWSDNCISGSCLVFDGVNDYVDVGNTSKLKPISNLSISIWLKINNLVQNNPKIIEASQNSNCIAYGYTLLPNNKITFDINTCVSGVGTTTSETTFDIYSWYFLVGTYDSNTIKFYVNGILENETTKSGNIIYNDICSVQIGAGHNSNCVASEFFNGTIDNLRIYNTSLSLEQVQFLYNNGRN